MKKRLPFILVGIGLIGLFGSFLVYGFYEQAKYNEMAQKVRAEASDREAKQHRIYSKPEVGMLFTKFIDLCGELGKGDNISNHESASGTANFVTMEYSKERSSSGCYGRFTFRNGELSTITR